MIGGQQVSSGCGEKPVTRVPMAAGCSSRNRWPPASTLPLIMALAAANAPIPAGPPRPNARATRSAGEVITAGMLPAVHAEGGGTHDPERFSVLGHGFSFAITPWRLVR
jgi:hypothetical protein